MQEIISKINNLSLSTTISEKVELLNELRDLIKERKDVAENVLNSETFLFQLLADTEQNPELYSLILEIVDCALSHVLLDKDEIFDIVNRILSNEHFCHSALKKIKNSLPVCVPKSTILILLKLIESEETTIGATSSQLLPNIIQFELVCDKDVQSQIFASIDSIGEVIVLCRILEILVEIAVKDDRHFECVVDLMETCMIKLEIDDVLVQMNVLEILQRLCANKNGIAYLEKNGMLKKYAAEIDNQNALLLPSLIKFFGSIAIVDSQKVFKENVFLVYLLFDVILQENVFLQYEALNTLGNIVRHDEGKKSLDMCCGENFCTLLKHIYARISNYTSEIKMRAILFLQNVFFTADSNNQITCICQKWFDSAFDSNLSTVLAWCKSPFPDSTCAFGLLESLCDHKFAHEVIAKTGGLIEFLLDRQQNSSSDVKYLKHNIMKKLRLSTAFDANTLSQINRYVEDGVFYVEQACDIAYESI